MKSEATFIFFNDESVYKGLTSMCTEEFLKSPKMVVRTLLFSFTFPTFFCGLKSFLGFLYCTLHIRNISSVFSLSSF